MRNYRPSPFIVGVVLFLATFLIVFTILERI